MDMMRAVLYGSLISRYNPHMLRGYWRRTMSCGRRLNDQGLRFLTFPSPKSRGMTQPKLTKIVSHIGDAEIYTILHPDKTRNHTATNKLFHVPRYLKVLEASAVYMLVSLLLVKIRFVFFFQEFTRWYGRYQALNHRIDRSR